MSDTSQESAPKPGIWHDSGVFRTVGRVFLLGMLYSGVTTAIDAGGAMEAQHILTDETVYTVQNADPLHIDAQADENDTYYNALLYGAATSVLGVAYIATRERRRRIANEQSPKHTEEA